MSHTLLFHLDGVSSEDCTISKAPPPTANPQPSRSHRSVLIDTPRSSSHFLCDHASPDRWRDYSSAGVGIESEWQSRLRVCMALVSQKLKYQSKSTHTHERFALRFIHHFSRHCFLQPLQRPSSWRGYSAKFHFSISLVELRSDSAYLLL